MLDSPANLSDIAVVEELIGPSTFELVLGTTTYMIIILLTIGGNVLVVMAVFTYQPLKKVQNYLLVSLAASDLTVAIVVMPLHVVKFLADGRWLLGVTICQLFTTADILLCTSSILNLCAIALDRYWAIHDPINYAQKRTLGFVCIMILMVWLASLVISVPPLIGWNDWTSQKLMTHCELTTEKAFVIFSASGSFFVPLAVMSVVYVKIFVAARTRIRTNRDRSALSKIIKQPATTQLPHPNKNASQKRSHSLMAERKGGKSLLAKMVSSTSTHTGQRPMLIHLRKRMERTASHSLGPATATSVIGVLFKREEGTKSRSGGRRAAKACHHIPHNLHPASEVIDSGVSTTALTQNGDASTSSYKGNSVSEMVKSNSGRPPSPIPAKKNTKKGKILFNQRHTQSPKATPSALDPAAALKQREKISVAKEKRAAKTIAVIIFCFVGCWLPFFCAYVILPFCESCNLHPKILQAFVWLGYINSSLNPFLYAICNMEFRRAFRKILCPARTTRRSN